MVQEVSPNTGTSQGEGVVVNSASLEDVALSESSDRAQSVQSLHSNVETPTPEAVPSYDELHQRLNAYNRHIAHMTAQKNELLQMHKDAKEHLSLLEQYQCECNEKSLSFDGRGVQGGGSINLPPNYRSVDEVQNDMAILAQRVKNITQLVDSQKQLLNQLPDANDDMRADQANLERKLNELRQNGNDLHIMATELDTLNTNVDQKALGGAEAHVENPTTTGNDVVPMCTASTSNGNATAAAVEKTIEQKEAEIETMKTQLKRLKEIMGTIATIENNSSSIPPPVESNQPALAPAPAPAGAGAGAGAGVSARNVPIRIADGNNSNNNYSSYVDDDHERTPTPHSGAITLKSADLERNLRILQGVSSDVRAQSERMVAERERIMALQDEISRCSQQAAAAAQLGEDALKRHSLTPTPIPFQRKNSLNDNQQEGSSIREREEPNKKQEYAELCRRLQEFDQQNPNQENIATTQQHNENINLNGTNAPESCNVETSSSTGAQTSQSNLTGSIQDDVSAELSSIQSNGRNSNAYSIPPSMTSWANCPHNWSYPNFLYTHPTTLISTNCAFPPPPSSNFSVPPFMSAVAPPPPPVSLFNPSLASATAPLSTALPTSMPPLFGPTVVDQTTLQHCINQQQMFSQAINQLNSMLWQQQREIEYLQRLTQKLQERLLRLDGDTRGDECIGFRSESIPPYTSGRLTIRPQQNMMGNNNNNTSVNGLSNRSQSEQPLVNNESEQHGSDGSQYQHHHYMQHHHHQQSNKQQQQFSHFSSNVGNAAAPTATGNSYSENQQHNASAASSSSIYSTLNNANVTARNVRPPMQQSTSLHETPGGPAPIFMNHHNNAIHQNNANLRRANANVSSSVNDANNTLNNQVPPGNRANNYWDNFKSYSRQNLLATHSNKSNEDNNQQQHQQQQQQHLEIVESGEYNPEFPRIQQPPLVGRHPVQSLRHKCLYQQTAYCSSPNDHQPPPTNIIHDNFTFHNNKIFHLGNEAARIKNFQQHHRQQQPNPLPLGSIITNPLHANRTVTATATSDINTAFIAPNENEMVANIPIDAHRQLFGYPVNELDDQITAEIYGCNYEQPHPSTSASFNINFGNSASNRHHGGNKVAPKFQYHMGLLTEQSMHMIESFLEHWDNTDNDLLSQEMVINNRQNINCYLRQLHQLQSTLRFDPNYIGPSSTSDYIERQIYMREDYVDQEEPELEQHDDNDDDDNTMRQFESDVNLNRNRNLLINNHNSYKPEKFAIKEIGNSSRHLSSCRFDSGNEENRTAYSDCTYHRRGSKNHMAGYERKYEILEWSDQSMAKNTQGGNQESIRHAVSESNVGDVRRDIPQESKTQQPQFPMTEIFSNPIPRTVHQRATPAPTPTPTKTSIMQQENVRIQNGSQMQEDDKIFDYDGDDTTNCETMDSMGAYSLAAQEHFQKKSILKGKAKQRKSMDKMNKSQKIHDDQLKAEEQSTAVYSPEAKKNNVQNLQANNYETASGENLPPEEQQNSQWNPSGPGLYLNGSQHNEICLNSECRALIHIVMTCLRTDLNSIVLVDNRILQLISKLTASISQNTLSNRDTPQDDDSLVLLSAERLFARLTADITNVPIRFEVFISWYERYLERLLLEAIAEDELRPNGSKKGIPHFMYPLETVDVDHRKDWSDFMDPIENAEFIEIERQRVWAANNLAIMENPIRMQNKCIDSNNININNHDHNINNDVMERNGESDENDKTSTDEIQKTNCDEKSDEKNNGGNNNKTDEKPSTRKKGTAQSRQQQQPRGGGKRNRRNKR